MANSPLRVTFDTNAYSRVGQPQFERIFAKSWPITKDRLLSKRDRIVWQYLNWCIRRGRIVAAIPEAAFAAEVLPNANRVALLVAIGTGRAAATPAIPPVRLAIIEKAFRTGFRALHCARVAYGDVVNISSDQWAIDQVFDIKTRQDRSSQFIRHFNDYAHQAVRDLGERLSIAHGLAAQNNWAQQPAAMNRVSVDRFLWRKGIEAEELNPRVYKSKKEFQTAFRNLMSEWTDFDVVAAHYSYGYDFLCTDDGGRQPSSILGSQHSNAVVHQFGVRAVTILELSKIVWKRFGLPLRTWH